jgi:hypothetical protein
VQSGAGLFSSCCALDVCAREDCSFLSILFLIWMWNGAEAVSSPPVVLCKFVCAFLLHMDLSGAGLLSSCCANEVFMLLVLCLTHTHTHTHLNLR